MKTATSIKLDPKIKDEATALAGEIGISLSSVINASLRQFVVERRLTLSATPVFNERTRKEFLKLSDDVRKNKNLSATFESTAALKKALLS